MKYKPLGFALLLAFTAFANDTVTFYGEVSDTTCNVTVDGVNGAVSVQLPTVAATELANPGLFAGATPFNFTVTDCSAATGTTSSKVGMRLLSASTANSGNLLNLAPTNPADNVVVQLLDNEGGGSAVIDFSLGEYTTTLQDQPATVANSLTFPFIARYYSTGTASVGKVQAQVQYALTYQ